MQSSFLFTVMVSSFLFLFQLEKYEASIATHRHARRQIPQEWAHAPIIRQVDTLLKKNNPQGIMHPIYSLLGEKGASEGMGMFDKKNFDCFQKSIADQAFTNAKVNNDLAGQQSAIIFASLEKNTPGVGLASAPCKSLTMKNKEIERLIQHQDAASPDAKKNNVEAALLVAESLKDIGTPMDDIVRLTQSSGTFEAGDPKNPNNGRGNSCDDKDDKDGCIVSKNLLKYDVTKEEIEQRLKV
ncbi:hypothetical protein O181_043934 [Austropuccinia psidii MF-1]|uniref:Uncharacterized protein n=1 Tax=Austropuccinia psidii MF-1 TaxID=1389203 RepID=A0A9Q3HIX7_9BASI|nr:hypothetical protein [Austropuccinia psidii MF-1]